jgi:Ca2+-binding RTX toxin-like protein
VAISLSYGGSAIAATALVGPSTAFPGETAFMYIAGAGEANSVTITLNSTTAFDLEIVDPGATISVGSGCTSVDPHTARCSSYQLYEDALEVDLGDGDDFLSLSFQDDSTTASFHGGDGNETIRGGSGREDSLEYLFGDAGDDVLSGREGVDVLDGGLGADILGGGSSVECQPAGLCLPDIDTVTYATRTNDVFADADGVADDGEALEGDLIRGNIEHIIGGVETTCSPGASLEGEASKESRISRGHGWKDGSETTPCSEAEPPTTLLAGPGATSFGAAGMPTSCGATEETTGLSAAAVQIGSRAVGVAICSEAMRVRIDFLHETAERIESTAGTG